MVIACAPWVSDSTWIRYSNRSAPARAASSRDGRSKNLSLAHKPFDLERPVTSHTAGIQIYRQPEPGKATTAHKVDLHVVRLQARTDDCARLPPQQRTDQVWRGCRAPRGFGLGRRQRVTYWNAYALPAVLDCALRRTVRPVQLRRALVGARGRGCKIGIDGEFVSGGRVPDQARLLPGKASDGGRGQEESMVWDSGVDVNAAVIVRRVDDSPACELAADRDRAPDRRRQCLAPSTIGVPPP